MFTSISLAGITPYSGQQATLEQLRELNFVYGPNGSGKTTISRVMADHSNYPTCKLVSECGSQPHVFVYNRDFVEKHFGQSNEIPGVFTVGSADKELLQTLADTKLELETVASRLEANRAKLDGPEGLTRKLQRTGSEFAEECWSAKEKHKERFERAFVGFQKNKIKFRDELLAQSKTNAEPLETIDELSARAEKLYSKELALVPRIEFPMLATIPAADKHPILRKIIVGRNDLDISGLIQKLGNSDWVRGGLGMVAGSDGKCPFCQQTIMADLEAQLNWYFEGSFETDRQKVAQLEKDYSAEFNTLMEWINEKISQSAQSGSFLQPGDLFSASKAIRAIASDNLNRIRNKQSALATVVPLAPIADELQDLWYLLDETNRRIDEHNQLVNNQRSESERLKRKVWKFLIADELKSDLAVYLDRCEQLNDGVTSTQGLIQADEERRESLQHSYSALVQQTSSSKPTIEKINATLRKLGFSRFSIESHGDGANYCLLRPDGLNAGTTLSEGEKTLVTFLYFFHLVQGEDPNAMGPTFRVAVLDDPISSLDSEVLFVISTLVRELCRKVLHNQGVVRQVFLLTHNIYFFKEITFKPESLKRKAKEQVAYWRIRKLADGSTLVRHESNPIKSSYELLWQELANSPGSAPSVTVQNCARRILEHFGRFIGNRKIDSFSDEFEGDELHLFRAMISWIHDGSHSSGDDLFITIEESSVDAFLAVFKAVFEKLGYPEHYDAMMNPPS